MGTFSCVPHPIKKSDSKEGLINYFLLLSQIVFVQIIIVHLFLIPC